MLPYRLEDISPFRLALNNPRYTKHFSSQEIIHCTRTIYIVGAERLVLEIFEWSTELPIHLVSEIRI